MGSLYDLMVRRLFCLFPLLLLTTVAGAQMGQSGNRMGMPSAMGMPADPKDSIDPSTKKRILLSNYCRLDYEGARLSPDGWKRFKPYTSMPANTDYRRLVIVTRYTVERAEPLAEVFYVNYQVVGYYDQSGGYVASAASERVEFQVEENNNELMVARVTPEIPRVSPRAAAAWMNLRLADPKTSDADRAHLKDALEKLNKFLPQPSPAAQPQGK